MPISAGIDADRRDRGPGLIGALLVGVSAAKAIAWSRGIPLVPVDHLQGHVASLYLGRSPSSLRSSACSRAAATRSFSQCGGTARSNGSARRSTTPPARRSTRAHGCSGCRIPAAPRSTRSPGRATPRHSGSRSRASRASTSPSPASRQRSSTPCATSVKPALPSGAPTSRPRTNGRSSCALTQRLRQAAESLGIERLAVVGGVAANAELRAALPEAALAPLSLCTDNAAMIASAARFGEPLPRPRPSRWMRMRRLPRPGVVRSAAPPPAASARRCSRPVRSSSWRGRAAPISPAGSAAGWESLLGDRPSAQLGGRWIVVLAKPSLATRVAAAGGIATEEQERAWTLAARDRSARGARAPRVPRRADRARARVLPGVQRLRDATRRARPRDRRPRPRRAGRVPGAGGDPGRGRAGRRRRPFGTRRREADRRSAIPGFSGAGVTVALLDTGVDLVHPYIRSALVRGFDVLDPGGNASAHQNPTSPGRPERHGTEMAGLVAGSRRAGRPRRRCARGRTAADPRCRLAARHVRRRLGLRPHRPAAGRHGARGRPERGR